MTRRRAPSIDALVAATFALIGVRAGARSITDNSAFTHLRTGVDMAAHGVIAAIPRVDPYTFTGKGHDWVVQSWLPEYAVGWTNRLFGTHAVVVLAGLTMGALAWFLASLARTGRPARTALATYAAVAVGVSFWTPRPLLVGLLCLAATTAIVDRAKAPWLLVPVVWIWVNSHGSFPLGLAWIAATCVGALVDARLRSNTVTTDREPPWRYLGWFVAGLAVAAINPLGPRLLTFAATPFTKSEVFRHIIEWQTVDFQTAGGLLCLSGLLLSVLVLARQRVPWRILVPVGGFLALGLFAQRNLAPLGVVLAPALGYALREENDAPAKLSPSASINRAFAAVLAALALVFLVSSWSQPALDTSSYPARSVTWLLAQGRFAEPHRVATRDTVGNYLELRRVPDHSVFVDDRFDMFPVQVSKDYVAMLKEPARGPRIVDRYQIDTVLWNRDTPLVAELLATGEWKIVRREPGWVVLFRV